MVPLDVLAGTDRRRAQRVRGHAAAVTSPAEVGARALAFNIMTARLSELMGALEDCVKERTEGLQHHALQLETGAQVSREIASLLGIDRLLKQVAELIKESFGHIRSVSPCSAGKQASLCWERTAGRRTSAGARSILASRLVR